MVALGSFPWWSRDAASPLLLTPHPEAVKRAGLSFVLGPLLRAREISLLSAPPPLPVDFHIFSAVTYPCQGPAEHRGWNYHNWPRLMKICYLGYDTCELYGRWDPNKIRALISGEENRTAEILRVWGRDSSRPTNRFCHTGQETQVSMTLLWDTACSVEWPTSLVNSS